MKNTSKNNHELIRDFYLAFQPIIKVNSSKVSQIMDYEILLRDNNNRFPSNKFQNILMNKRDYNIYLKWMIEELTNLIDRFPKKVFDINIDPQQLFYQETWEFISIMSMYKNNLIIEITERIPFSYDYFTKEIRSIENHLDKIKSWGYTIALDDVGCGQNSLGQVINNYYEINRIKLSLYQFRNIKTCISSSFLQSWIKLSKEYQLEIVVEGIETKKMAEELTDSNYFCLQQGFYWGIPRKLDF